MCIERLKKRKSYHVNPFERVDGSAKVHGQHFPISNIISLGNGRKILTNNEQGRSVAENDQNICKRREWNQKLQVANRRAQHYWKQYNEKSILQV